MIDLLSATERRKLLVLDGISSERLTIEKYKTIFKSYYETELKVSSDGASTKSQFHNAHSL